MPTVQARPYAHPACPWAGARVCAVWIILIVGIGLGACSKEQTAPRPGTTEYLVRDIRFEGNDAFDDATLAEALATVEHAFNPFQSRQYLNTYDLNSDIQRVETFYHARGYFDAEVLEQEVDYDEGRQRATIVYRVDEGFPSYVNDIRYDRQIGGDVFDAIRRQIPAREGVVFSKETMDETAALIRRRLQDMGYAYAQVEARAFVDRRRYSVALVFSAEPGVECVFGEISVEGAERVPAERVIEESEIRQGATFRPTTLNRARENLYQLDTYSTVDITPILDEERSGRRRQADDEAPDSGEESRWRAPVLDDEVARSLRNEGYELAMWSHHGHPVASPLIAQLPIDLGAVQRVNPQVPVVITVSEAPAATYRFGLGSELESGRLVAFGRANAVWRDVFAPLNRFEADIRLGYAWLPSPLLPRLADTSISNRGIVTRSSIRYFRPRLLFNNWNFTAQVRAEREVELIYNVRSFGGDLTIDRRWGQRYRQEFGYSVDFSREDSTVDARRDAYRLAWLRSRTTFDFRDDPLQPRRGFFGELQAELGDPATGEFFFLLVRPEVRGYIPVGRRLTIATRASAGWIVDLGDSAPVPQNHRFYDGGSTGFRGVPYRRLSPYQFRLRDDVAATPDRQLFDTRDACVAAELAAQTADPDADFNCRGEPVGGFFSALFSLEPRYEIGRDWLFAALFADVGTVQTELVPDFSLGGDALQIAVGGGLRIATPVGPIRLDLGYRITDARALDDPRPFVFFLAIGESF